MDVHDASESRRGDASVVRSQASRRGDSATTTDDLRRARRATYVAPRIVIPAHEELAVHRKTRSRITPRCTAVLARCPSSTSASAVRPRQPRPPCRLGSRHPKLLKDPRPTPPKLKA